MFHQKRTAYSTALQHPEKETDLARANAVYQTTTAEDRSLGRPTPNEHEENHLGDPGPANSNTMVVMMVQPLPLLPVAYQSKR
jgi:hypothetical protein